MVATVLPDLDVGKRRRLCKQRVPDRIKDEVRLEVTAKARRVSIDKRRPLLLGAGNASLSVLVDRTRTGKTALVNKRRWR